MYDSWRWDSDSLRWVRRTPVLLKLEIQSTIVGMIEKFEGILFPGKASSKNRR